jgi:2-haloacid dehalogenase
MTQRAPYFDGRTVLTFDVYGTLIDWETGIDDALQPVLKAHGVDFTQDQGLEIYAKYEAELEAGPYLTYREVLAESLRRIGQELGFTPSDAEVETFSQSVGDWPAFPDSPAALQSLKKQFKLAVITNCDDELFAMSAKRLGVEFDYIITAQQARSYKPSLNNFHLAFGRIEEPREQILHVAQSMFHDHVPAKSLGLTSVWINRRHDKPGFGATPAASAAADAEFPDMQSFAAAAAL